MVRESKIENDIQAWCKAHGVLCVKFTPMGEAGWPDRMFGYKGRVLWIELKATGKKARPLQQARLNQLKSYGFIAECYDNVSSAIELLEATFFPRDRN